MDPVIGGMLVLLVGGAVASSVRIRTLKPHQRGVVFRFGRYHGLLGPSCHFVFSPLDKLVVVDTSPVTLRLDPLEVRTTDGWKVPVTAEITLQIIDVEGAVVRRPDFKRPTVEAVEKALMNRLTQHDREEVRDPKIQTKEAREICEEVTRQSQRYWGVQLLAVEVKDVGLGRLVQE